jgi:hypothetical protein
LFSEISGGRSKAEIYKICAQLSPTAKAAFILERFCPQLSMAPVLGDCKDGGWDCPE